MRMLVTGRDGQVGRSLVELAAGRFEIVRMGRPHLDLAGAPEKIVEAIKSASPQIIVSVAAYTLVDQAESEPDLAFAINERGARAVAIAARELDVPLIHLSTDYVFDGTKDAAYVETDSTSPTGVYGLSKLGGEKAALAEHDNTAVLRTAWVYSPFGANFVKTMLRLAGERDEVRVVSDQRGNPTSALDIARGICVVAGNLQERSGQDLRGVFHMTAGGDASWAEFAKAIFDASTAAGGPSALVCPITTADYPTAATRPANSRLDCSKIERVHQVRLPNWRSSLTEVVSRLVQRAA